MALQNFVDRTNPVVSAAWLNAVDRIKESWLGTSAEETAAGVVPAAPWFPPGYIERYGGTGDGATNNTAAFTAGDSVSVQAKGPTIKVHTGLYRISDNLTIQEDLDFSRGGGMISVDAGKTLTIAGRIIGPPRQYFTGAGSVVVLPGRNEFVLPEWWGAIPDDSTDCYAAIAKAIAALPTGGGTYGGIVHFLKGIYRSSDKILQPNGVELRGISCNTSCIKATNTFNKTALIANSAQDGTQEFARITDLMLDGNKAAGAVCSVAVVDWVSLFVNSYIRDCLIQNGSNDNLHIGANNGGGPVLVDNTWLLSPNGHNILIDEAVANTNAVAGIGLRNCTVEHQAAGKCGIRIKGYGRIFGVNITDLHVEQANSGAGTYGIQIDGAGDVKMDGIQLQSSSTSSGGIRIENNVLNTRYSAKNVTNINTINPCIDDQLEGVQFTGVHVPWYCSSDFGVFKQKQQTLTYGASVATNLTLGNYCILVITNGTAFTIANPTNAQVGQRLTYEIVNSSGGAHGTISWGANFAYRDASFGAIANGKRRTIMFEYRGSNVWAQIGAATGDM
ncbi:MAG: glycosyl hydrolase family 28-related protein [Gemmatimonadales bacterium]|nr:glycosyl hydrolase family 28-related protein [Gemmatimonadales bacterium]